MIKFRQKIFVAPVVLGALNALGTTAMAGSVLQGFQQSKQNEEMMKQQEEIAQQQAKQNQQTIKALNNIAKEASKNPATANAAANVMNQAQEVQYSVVNAAKEVGSLLKNVGKIAVKDNHVLLGGVMAGGAMGLGSYATDKAIQYDMKKQGIPLPPKITSEEKRYSLPTGSILSRAKGVLKNSWKKNKGMIITTTALGSIPTGLSYLSQRQSMIDQVNNNNNNNGIQKSYSASAFIKNGFNSFTKSIKDFKNNAGVKTLGFMSTMSGGGGMNGVKRFGRQLKTLGKQSGSKLTEKTGNFILNHPKTALAGSIPVGIGIMSTTWEPGEKIVSNAMRKVDNNAYRYQDYQNQMMY